MALEYNLDHISDKQKKTNIRKALSILEKAFYKKIETQSFFLDPFEQKTLAEIAKKNSIDICFLGGNPDAERKIFVANYYYEPLYEPNYISVLEFEASDIHHPDVLGALLSLGIDRNDIGDISILDNKVEFVISNEQASFVEFNITKIKNDSVNIKVKKDSKLDLIKPKYEDYIGFVSSLRIDNLLSLFLSTSRTKAKEIVKDRLVKVDFQIIEDPSYQVDEGCLISVRRFGRFVFDRIDGYSKKGNYHIKYRKVKWYI